MFGFVGRAWMVALPVDAVVDGAAVPTERLEAEACTLAAQLAAATCRFLLIVAELDRREAWRQWGCASMAQWLSWKCGARRGGRPPTRAGGAGAGALARNYRRFQRGPVELLQGAGVGAGRDAGD